MALMVVVTLAAGMEHHADAMSQGTGGAARSFSERKEKGSVRLHYAYMRHRGTISPSITTVMCSLSWTPSDQHPPARGTTRSLL
jgi:hypothetical protein